jgi:hypothetical protein
MLLGVESQEDNLEDVQEKKYLLDELSKHVNIQNNILNRNIENIFLFSMEITSFSDS